MGLISNAAMFATEAHADQVRKYTGTPYIIHPFEVMEILILEGYRIDTMLAAALLHDVVEDTPVTQDEIFVTFGPDVSHLVYLLTDTETGNRAERKRQQRERLGGSEDALAQTIKCADLISNAHDIKQYEPKFFKVFQQEGEALLDVMIAAYPPLRNKAYAALAC